MHEHILTAAFLRDEAEALLTVEELYLALASADDLRGHAVEAAATACAATTAAAAEAAAATAATCAAILESATVLKTAAVVVSAAAATAAATVVKSATVLKTAAEIATGKRLETIFADVIPLVAPAPTSFIVTHNSPKTLLLQPVRKTKSRKGADGRLPALLSGERSTFLPPVPHQLAPPLSQNARGREPIRNRPLDSARL